MAEEDQKKTLADASRRHFVLVGMSSLALAGVGGCLAGYEYLSPNVLYEPSPVVNAGKPDSYPADSVSLDPQSGIYLIHAAEGFYALASICTHLGCMTAWKPELNMIACPCHGSRFTREGIKIAGPAPRPLPWLKVSMSDEGELMVDRSIVVSPRTYVRV
jgi:cytochrome b6-f complex iron-sulfur subunit